MAEFKPTVLIIEETLSEANAIKDALHTLDFDVEIADSGEKALKNLNSIQPDIILLNILMPGLNGYEICMRLKQKKDFKHIPIIFLSALSDSVDKIKAFQLGAVDFISKPIQRDELLVRVKSHLINSLNHIEKINKQVEWLEEKNTKLSTLSKELQLEKERNDLIIQGARVGTFEWHIPTDTVIRNEVAANLIGYNTDDLGKDNKIWLSLVHPDDLKLAQKTCARSENRVDEVVDVSYRIKHKNGQWVWLECRGKITEKDASNQPIKVSGILIDVSAERETQMALIESEENYRILSESTHEGILIHDKKKVIDSNQALANILGFTAKDLAINKPLPMDLVSEKDRSSIEKKLLAEYNGTYEIEMKRLDGVYIDCELETNDITYKGKKHRVVAFRDITHKKQAQIIDKTRLTIIENYRLLSIEEILKITLDSVEFMTKSEEGFYIILDNNQEVESQIWSHNSIKKQALLNNIQLDLKQLEIQDIGSCFSFQNSIISNDFKAVTAPDLFPELNRAIFIPTLQKENVISILCLGNKKSDYLPRDISLAEEVVNIAWEIIEKKKTEEALQVSQEKYRFIFENASIGMSISDISSGKILEVNKYLMEKLEYRTKEEVQTGIYASDYYASPEARKEVMHLLKRNNSLSNQEVELLRKDGTKNWFSISYFLNKKNGTIETFILDINEEKKAQEELKLINKRLQGLENIIHHKTESINDLLDYTLHEIVEYTKSDKGYIYHFQPSTNLFILNNWSDSLVLSYIPDNRSHEEQALDCLNQAVSEKKAIIINEPNHQYPFVKDKSSPLLKSMSIPILIKNEVVAIVWLGSQKKNYSLFDAEQVSLLLETTWILVEKQKLQDEQQQLV